MQHVLQLAGIARPAVGQERILGRLAQLRQRQIEPVGIHAEEILGQRQNIARSLAQRRQQQLALLQQGKQLGIESARTHRERQVQAAGREQAYVHRQAVVVALALHLTELQHLEQAPLQRQ